MKRLHIVGCPRSGTTLLLQLTATCFANDGHCAHEMSIFQSPPKNCLLYISKQPNDIRQLRHIFRRDENLHVIYMGRDPRAVITSMHPQHPGQYFCNYRIWRECDDAAMRYRGHPRFLELRYEDLVSKPDSAQQQVQSKFHFLQARRLFSDYHLHARPSRESQQAMNGLRQIDGDNLEKWRGHLPRLAQQYRRHPQLAEDVKRLGYAADDNWLELLRDVKAREYPCRYGEHRKYLKEWEKALRVYFKSRRYLKQASG